MRSTDQRSLFIAILLIGTGVVFLAMALIPGFSLGALWPIIFFFIAAGFYLPSIIWTSASRELAALYIPGSVMLVLGLIFIYNTLFNDWAVWAYAWLLIPAGVGGGLAVASRMGEWGQAAFKTGIWMMLAGIVLFSFFAILFGSMLLKTIGPVLMIGGGILILLRGRSK